MSRLLEFLEVAGKLKATHWFRPLLAALTLVPGVFSGMGGWEGDVCVERGNKHDPAHNQLLPAQAPPM